MNLKFLILPVACGISLMPYSSANSAFRVTNDTMMSARHGVYTNQVMSSTVATVPANVSVGTNSAELEACQMIYPNGEFQIARPTVGLRAGGEDQCVSVINLVGYQMGPAGTNLVFATANVAAGDSFKCNIDSFPQAYMNKIAVESVEFPADSEPTIDDVVETMNQEQKQNAGIKIAAAAIIGGLGGNVLGKNDVGKDNMIGTDKGKLRATGVGAAGAAALMAASTYSGKVAGDVILSTGVNATAGAVIGNAAAAFGGGDSALHIEKECKVKSGPDTELTDAKNCLWGVIQKGAKYSESKWPENDKDEGKVAFWSPENKRVVLCKNSGEGQPSYQDCHSSALANVRIEEVGGVTPDANRKNANKIEEIDTDDFTSGELENLQAKCNYYMDKTGLTISTGGSNEIGGVGFCKIKSAIRVDSSIPVILTGFSDELATKWKESRTLGGIDKANLYKRDANGNGTRVDELKNFTMNDFKPLTIDAEDGGIVDFSNKARAKGTAIGAAAGGALGGISAYSGAQDEINERWVMARTEYKDSLQKFVCMTGNRFLSYYNDTVAIPNPQPVE